jgi:hypothetical protein
MKTGRPRLDDSSARHLVVESNSDFRVDSRVYSSPQVFDLEMRRIFDRPWVYVGLTISKRR